MRLLIDKEGLQKHRDKIFNDILEMLETNQRVGCVQPTGIGKSYCIARLCNKLKGKKLVLEPGNEVINYMQKFNIETPDTNYITYYSLLKPSATDLANMFKEYDYIFLDEMHRALADKWGKQLDKTFAILDVLEAKYKILGFSATPTRMDNRDAVEEIFHGVQIEPYYLQDAILDGILPNIEYHSSIYEITDKDKKKIELKDTPLVKQILSYDIDEGVSKIFQENLDLSQPHHIIVFVDRIVNISEAIDNMKKWLKVDFSIYKAHSKMSYKESKEAIENFQKDKGLSLMFAVDILNEGVHLDKVDTSVFLRKTSSTRVYNQQLGRVISDTIENPKVFDLVNNIDNLDTGYAFMFKEKANQLNTRTEQLVTKNGEHLKIITHQGNLVEKLSKMFNKCTLTEKQKEFINLNSSNKTRRELAELLGVTYYSVNQYCKLNHIETPIKYYYIVDFIKNMDDYSYTVEDIMKIFRKRYIEDNSAKSTERSLRTFVKDACKRYNKKCKTQKELDREIKLNEIKDLIDRNYNSYEICKEINTTQKELVRFLSKNNKNYLDKLVIERKINNCVYSNELLSEYTTLVKADYTKVEILNKLNVTRDNIKILEKLTGLKALTTNEKLHKEYKIWFESNKDEIINFIKTHTENEFRKTYSCGKLKYIKSLKLKVNFISDNINTVSNYNYYIEKCEKCNEALKSNKNLTIKDACRMYGISLDKYKRWRLDNNIKVRVGKGSHNSRAIPKDVILKVVELNKAGLSVKEICNKTKVTRNQYKYIIKVYKNK